MRRGELWWADFVPRQPVVILSATADGFEVMQVVPASGADIDGLGVEVPIGPIGDPPVDGVLRMAHARPGWTPCTWLTTVPRESLTSRIGQLPRATMAAIDEAIRTTRQPKDWTPTTAARFQSIRNALRGDAGTRPVDGDGHRRPDEDGDESAPHLV
jgi:mRNA interferase MazF